MRWSARFYAVNSRLNRCEFTTMFFLLLILFCVPFVAFATPSISHGLPAELPSTWHNGAVSLPLPGLLALSLPDVLDRFEGVPLEAQCDEPSTRIQNSSSANRKKILPSFVIRSAEAPHLRVLARSCDWHHDDSDDSDAKFVYANPVSSPARSQAPEQLGGKLRSVIVSQNAERHLERVCDTAAFMNDEQVCGGEESCLSAISTVVLLR
jgi:hypothetical protein